MRIKLITVLFVAFLAALSVLAASSHRPAALQFVFLTPGLDKLGHLVLAFIFAGLLSALTGYRRIGGTLLLGCLLVVAISTVDELSQHWISNRSSSMLDLACDFLGIGLAQIFLRGSAPAAEH